MRGGCCLVVVALLAVAGCSAEASDDARHGPAALSRDQFRSITLERTPCYGYCPAYELTIHADGRVVYLGHDFVESTGERTATIDEQAVQRLIEAVVAADFRTLEAGYWTKIREDGSEVRVSDLPTRITTLRTADGEQRVENYFGGPPALARLEDTIDALAGSARWVGERAKRSGGSGRQGGD